LNKSLRELWSYRRLGLAKRFWQRWYRWATYSRLPAMIEATRFITPHLPIVLTYFTHRITNAVPEGLNSKIARYKNRPMDSEIVPITRLPSISTAAVLTYYPVQLAQRKV